MEPRLVEALGGGVGYFWSLESPAMGALDEGQAAAGSFLRRGDRFEVHLLQDDPLASFGEEVSIPAALVGATEHGGVLVLDLSGSTRNMSVGGSRASVDRYRARTLVVHPSIVEAKTTLLASASAYFRSTALLGWAGFDAVERQMETDVYQHVRSATITLRPMTDRRVQITPTVDLRVSGRWNFRDDEDLRHVIETALELEVSSRKPVPVRKLVFLLLRCQDLLSVAFGGFLVADGGRAGLHDMAARGHLWDARLMPTSPPTHVPVAAKNARPWVRLADLGGDEAFPRWIRLCKSHPRAVGPIINLYRRGESSDDVRLLEIASAMEYWVAAHRRRSGWTRQGDNHAEAVARHIGRAFADWSGNASLWAAKFWDTYNKLKHDPSFAPDPFEVYVLQKSGYLVLLAEVLNRLGRSKRPGQHLFANYQHDQLKEWTLQLLSS